MVPATAPAAAFRTPPAESPGPRAVVADRPRHERVCGEQASPVRVEGLAVPGREGRHRHCLRVGLMLEERVEVGGLDVTEYRHDPQRTTNVAVPSRCPYSPRDRARKPGQTY